MRLLALFGFLLILVGLGGYWFSQDVQRTTLSLSDKRVLAIPEDTFHASFLLAGRDIAYTQMAGRPRYNARGQIVGWGRAAKSNAYGTNTDTIFYVQIIGTKIYMIAIPRDVYLVQDVAKINAMYYLTGVDGFKDAVSNLLGLPIDYYAIINIDMFKDLVDAMGGVDVTVPYDMKYIDEAAQLYIDLKAGFQHLDGEQAAGFVRFRNTPTGDYSRIDNIKTLAHAMLKRLRELNVRAIGTLPKLVDIFFEDVETNASPMLVRQLIPRLNKLEIYAATIPTHVDPDGSSKLFTDAEEIEEYLAEVFESKPRRFTQAPRATLLITDRSGIAGLGKWLKKRLVALGVPEERIYVGEEEFDPAPTRMLTTNEFWRDANYYTSLLDIGKQQVIKLDGPGKLEPGLELILGEDARRYISSQATLSQAP